MHDNTHHTSGRALGLVAILILSALSLSGQITSSPYSRYGYGVLSDGATSTQRQMGGTGYAQRSGRQINVMNPASYAGMDSLTFLFDMGADVSMFWRKDAMGHHHDWGGGIDYITLQAPVSKTVGVSAGLLPFSSVGYSFGSSIDNGASSNQGVGGINELYIGAGWTPLKGLAIGANISYLFGNITNATYATTSASNSAVFEQMMEIKDYHLRFGAQYTYNISRRNSVTVGVSYEPGKSLLGKTYVRRYLSVSSGSVDIDTLAPGVVKLHNRFSLAPSYGVGVAYDWNEQLHAEVDFTYQPWKDADYTQLENFTATRLADRWRVGVGASFIPNPRGGFFKRVAYRAGAFYNRDYIMVGDNHVRDYGVSVGFGFPALASKTMINLGFEYRNRQATPDPLLKEQYFNVTLGVNFNQVWFYRNKLR